MHQKTDGIVLHALKYGDNSLIVKIFTREYGLRSFMIRGFRSKKSNLSASLFIPLTFLTMDISKKAASNFNTLHDAQCLQHMHSIQSNFGKQAVALFIAEVLYKTIADDAAHDDLYSFIEGVLKYLNETNEVPPVFPQHFLVSYSRYLGLRPTNHGETAAYYFDMRDGIFTNRHNLHSDFMMEEESNALKQLLETPITELHEIKMGNALRNNLLHGLLHYYKIHLLNFREIRSHTVLTEVLRG